MNTCKQLFIMCRALKGHENEEGASLTWKLIEPWEKKDRTERRARRCIYVSSEMIGDHYGDRDRTSPGPRRIPHLGGGE